MWFWETRHISLLHKEAHVWKGWDVWPSHAACQWRGRKFQKCTPKFSSHTHSSFLRDTSCIYFQSYHSSCYDIAFWKLPQWLLWHHLFHTFIFFLTSTFCVLLVYYSQISLSQTLGTQKKFHYIRGFKIFMVKTQRKVVGMYHVWEVLLYFIQMSVSLVFTLGGSIFTEGNARQQRGHDRLPGQSLSPLPDPGSACTTPRQLIHSRPKVLWSSVQ